MAIKPVSGPGTVLAWHSLTESDLLAITELAGICRAADDGQPFATAAGFARQRYLAGAVVCAAGRIDRGARTT